MSQLHRRYGQAQQFGEYSRKVAAGGGVLSAGAAESVGSPAVRLAASSEWPAAPRGPLLRARPLQPRPRVLHVHAQHLRFDHSTHLDQF